MIKRFIQKIRCSLPFSFYYFGHRDVYVVRQLGISSQLSRCRDCGKMFAINNDVRVILPWAAVHANNMDTIRCWLLNTWAIKKIFLRPGETENRG